MACKEKRTGKIIVLGAGGMAGHMITLYLMENGYDVTGFARKKLSFCKCIEGDALDTQFVKKILQKGSYEAVINCIGILNKNVDANLSEGIFLNSVFPHFLQETTSDMPTRVIHISTDCVFSGKTGHYTEDSIPDAMSYYGKTKALGEIVDDKNLTIRTSVVGPELKDGIGLFHWFMSQEKEVTGFTEVIWTGVTTLELAKAVDVFVKQEVTGLYHLVNGECITKYDLLCLFNEYMRRGGMIIHQNGSLFNDKSLLDTRRELKYSLPGYEEMVCELAEWMKKHQGLYGRYFSE